MIVLDTSVLSRVFRRQRPGRDEERVRAVVEDLMTSDAQIGLPGIVLQEVLSGIRSESQFAGLARRLVTAFAILHPTTADHVEAARLRSTCLAKGLNVSGPDCLIASLVVGGDHELFTEDADLAAIAKHAPIRLFQPSCP